ncbi:MAG: head decoration protein [Methylococcales bacterium]|jgi:hypothetical protein|nr:head decoration protein [Methylococcales bacterium]
MPVLEQANTIGDVLHYEEDHQYSREVVTLAKGKEVKIGTILVVHEQNGNYFLWHPQGKDGLDKPVAISISNESSDQTDLDILTIVRHAILKASGLIWPDNITDKQSEKAIDQLSLIGLLLR